MEKVVNVIGAGLAGVEACHQLVKRGYQVRLYEMRPNQMTPAHHSGNFAELVCSNSLRADGLNNAVGVLKKEMEKQNIRAAAGIGGATGYLVDMLEHGYIKTFFDPQDFDQLAIRSLYNNRNHHEISASDYANPFNGNPYVNLLDVAVLSATEMDVKFNVNVLTDSYGRLMGAPVGHTDAAAGADVTIVAMPLLRGRLPMILDNVQTVVTPGETVDVVVTEYGIAVNPKRDDLYNNLKKSNLPIVSIEELYIKAQKLAGKAAPLEHGNNICGIVEYRDGTIIDVIYDV